MGSLSLPLPGRGKGSEVQMRSLSYMSRLYNNDTTDSLLHLSESEAQATGSLSYTVTMILQTHCYTYGLSVRRLRHLRVEAHGSLTSHEKMLRHDLLKNLKK
jgi:hypothetical protein